MANNPIFKIGHRGAKGYVAENTLASFQKALDLGVDGIELDVHLTLDGKIAVIHDETLDRTTDGKGHVNALSFPTLKNFKIENNYLIPELAEVFDLINRKCFINVELKGNGTAKPVVDLIAKYVSEHGWKYTDFIVSGFDWKALDEVRHLNSEIPLGVLTSTDLELAIAFAEFVKAYAIHPYFHLLTAENTMRIRQKGFLVFPWTVNELEDLQQMKAFKVNGIITDFPDRI